jgi:DNA-binding HxlR family transcriptional regulator
MPTTTDFSRMHCSIARSFGVMGDPWKAMIIRDLHLGLTRFDQIVEDLGVSRKVLTERLNAMIADDLIQRNAYQNHPPRFDYILTEQGLDLVPVILAALAWGDRWLSGSTGVPAIAVHRNHECRAEIVCSVCHEPLAATDVTGAVGPGGVIGPGTQLIGTKMSR